MLLEIRWVEIERWKYKRFHNYLRLFLNMKLNGEKIIARRSWMETEVKDTGQRI